MAYTVDITNGTTTYTFQVTPRFRPRFDYEYNESAVPPVLLAEIETWTLEGGTYVSATQANVTSDLESLRALLGSRATPVTSVKFKRDGSTVRELNTTSHAGGIMVRSLETAGGDGEWAGYWSGTLVVYGRRLFTAEVGAGGVAVRYERVLEYTYDAAGLATATSRGEVTTGTSTSAEAVARAQALTSPGADYGLLTQGPNGEPSIRVLDATDTRASWESTWKQHGVALPAGVNEWSKVEEVSEDPDNGRVTYVSVSAKGPTFAQVLTAVRSQRPEGTRRYTETSDRTTRSASARYEVPAASAEKPDPEPGIVFRRVTIRATGLPVKKEDRDVTVYPIPGYAPVFVARPRPHVTITESVTTQYLGTPGSIDAMGLASRLAEKTGLYAQPSQGEAPALALREKGLSRRSDRWEGTATYVYMAAAATPEELFTVVKEQVI